MVVVKLEGEMYKKFTLLGIVTAIVILAVCIGAATAGDVSNTASATGQKDLTAIGDTYALPSAAGSNSVMNLFSNYDAVWSSSSNQFLKEDMVSGIIGTPVHGVNQFGFTISPSSNAIVMTPFVNSISKTGTHPMVRYLYYELQMPVGVSVTTVTVDTGTTDVYAGSPGWAGTGAVKDYTLDMGSYHDMVRGITTAMIITNPQASSKTVYTQGVGAKQEW
jgi:hypothetical protein